MKQSDAAARGKSRRKSRGELNQEGRERKRQKKRRGHVAGSRTSVSATAGKGRSGETIQDPRLGSKKRVPLGRNIPPAPVAQQTRPKNEKPLTPQQELALLENDERLDDLLERIEQGGVLDDEEQVWVDAKLDRIDELMQQLGLSCDDDDDPQDEEPEDMMRLLKGC